MGNFNRDNRSGGRSDFGRRSFGGDRGTDRQMFKTTCSNCGRECEVPFKPSGAKPVYCNDCFRTMGSPDSRRSDSRGTGRSSFGDRDNRPRNNEQPQNSAKFDELNAKLDKILAMFGSSTSTAKLAKAPSAPKPEAVVEVEAPQVVETPLATEMPELPEVPQEGKVVEELQLQPEEPTLIPEKKKRASRKTTLLPTPE